MDLSDNEQYADNRRVAEEAAQAAGKRPAFYVEDSTYAVTAIDGDWVARVDRGMFELLQCADEPDDEAAERVRIRAEHFPGTVSTDDELRERLTQIVGQARVNEVIDALHDHRYERVRANVWVNAFTLIRPSEETLAGIGKTVLEHVSVPGESVIRVGAN